MNRNGAEVTLKTTIAVRAEKRKAIMAKMPCGPVLPGKIPTPSVPNAEERGHHGEHPVLVEPPQGKRTRQQQHPGDDHRCIEDRRGGLRHSRMRRCCSAEVADLLPCRVVPPDRIPRFRSHDPHQHDERCGRVENPATDGSRWRIRPVIEATVLPELKTSLMYSRW